MINEEGKRLKDLKGKRNRILSAVCLCIKLVEFEGAKVKNSSILLGVTDFYRVNWEKQPALCKRHLNQHFPLELPRIVIHLIKK